VKPETLLIIANFPAGTGYAWDFFQELYAAASDELARAGVRTVVAFPELDGVPERLARSSAEPVVLQVSLGSLASVAGLVRFIRREHVRVLYLTDQPAWHPAYAVLRLAGIHRIVVYDQTSGARTPPAGAKRWLKRLSRGLPGTTADRVLAVGEYVAQRHREVGLIPEEKIETVWNSILLPDEDPHARERLRKELNLPPNRTVLGCTARAAEYKGIHVLLQAFERVWSARSSRDGDAAPVLVYVGDGPELERLKELRDGLAAKRDILFTGYRPNAAEVAAAIDLAVVPSLWQEAFGLSVLEPMAHGRPVVASAVGGIPEIVQEGETGRLVPPGDVEALSGAIAWMLDHPVEARRMGVRGRERARRHFNRETQVSRLIAALRAGFTA
jgi:glycosyltransferase involved in cell wall biosynthesis